MIYEILKQLANTDSTIEKEAILFKNRDNTLLSRVFALTYTKQINFGVKKLPDPVYGFAPLTLTEALDILENEFCTRKVSGNSAIDRLAGILGSVSDNDHSVLRRIIDRDLDCGVGRTIPNKIWKGIIPEQPCYLAQPYSEKTIARINFPAVAQLKADGARCMAEVRGGKVTLLSRAGNEYLMLPGIVEALQELAQHVPYDFMVDGELVYIPPKVKVKKGLDLFLEDDDEEQEERVADRTKGNGLANKALKGTISTEEADGMVLQVWDLVELDVTYGRKESTVKCIDRLKQLEAALAKISSLKLDLIEYTIVKDLDEAKAVYRKYVAMDLEGIILKNLAGLWEDKRGFDQVKFKEEIQFDGRVVAVYPHEKNPRKLGGITVVSECGRVRVNCGSGFKDTDTVKDKKTKSETVIPINQRHEYNRARLWHELDTPDTILNSIVQLKCNGWLLSKSRKDGMISLFLPIFELRRRDKTKANTFEEVFGITADEAIASRRGK